MDQAVLVGFDIEKGQHVIDLLDGAGYPPEVALWAMLPEYDRWRFVLASSHIHGYEQMVEQFHAAGITPDTRPSIHLREIDDPFIEALRKIFAPSKSVRGARIGGQYFGPQFIEDGYLYRVC